MSFKWMRKFIIIWLFVNVVFQTQAEYAIDYKASFITNVGKGSFAPYYMSSNIHGIMTQPQSALVRGYIGREMKTTERFSYGFGLDLIGGYTSKTGYDVFSTSSQTFHARQEKPAWGWIQQLFGEVKYRSLFLSVGMKERNSALLNQQLSSGDLVESGNARPMPGIRLGFIDFQNIPFTKGWLQIQGEFGYAKQMDGKWLENHFNYYTGFMTTDTWSSYKRLYFRTKPTKRFSITIGMQAASQFGGKYSYYENGALQKEVDFKLGLKDFVKAFIPLSGSGENSMLEGDGYYAGNHLGSWDFVAQYRLKNNDVVKGYFQFPWEDGSGIGKMNGWDGLWGVEYQRSQKGYINGVVLEYIDFRNQGGPIHWAPGDFSEDVGSKLPNHATGADDYYNNYMYNGYQYYGMSIGTPFAKSPVYNKDGFMRYTDNRLSGFHFGIMGNILPTLEYRCLFSYRAAWGTPFLPSLQKNKDTSVMIEGVYSLPKVQGLQLKGQFALDRGSLYGNNAGVMLSVSYNGILNF